MKRPIDHLQDVARVLSKHHLPEPDVREISRSLTAAVSGNAEVEDAFTALCQPSTRGDDEVQARRKAEWAEVRNALEAEGFAHGVLHSVPCLNPKDRPVLDSAVQYRATRDGAIFRSRRRNETYYYAIGTLPECFTALQGVPE